MPTYTVSSGDAGSPSAVATHLASAITSNSTLHTAGISATASGTQIIISALSSISVAPSATGSTTASVGGGGRLAQVTNTTISNSPISYSFDALGRTYNRMINGANNSVSKTFDQMSRIIAETNPLGVFNYGYVDDNPTTFTIGGTAAASCTETITVNGHVASYASNGYDTLQSIANNLTYQVNQLGIVGISAAVNGDVISVQAPPGSTISGTAQSPVTITQNSTATSKGCPRLAYASYPNGQMMNLSYLPNIGDHRLQQISNILLTGTTTSSSQGLSNISQFNYSYNSAGEITQWLQTQNGNSSLQNLGYDLASQLVSAPTKASSSSSNVFNVYVSGTAEASASETLSVTAYDTTLSTGSVTASYSAASGTSASTIASNLASSIQSQMSSLGITASASGGTIAVTQASSANATNFTCLRSGKPETITLAQASNNTYTSTIGNTPNSGDTVSLTAYDPSLSGGSQYVSTSVTSGISTFDIATNLAAQINSNSNLNGIGVTALVQGSVITISTAVGRSTTLIKLSVWLPT